MKSESGAHRYLWEEPSRQMEQLVQRPWGEYVPGVSKSIKKLVWLEWSE